MMINKIELIKNLGIFYDYKGDPKLPEFKRYNLIYGWNGGGKTTLSNLFAMLEDGSSPDYPSVQYKILFDKSNKVKQGQKLPHNVRVFNRNFVRDNSPSLENPEEATKHIFILGKEDKGLAAQNEKDKKEKSSLENLLSLDDKKAGKTSLNTKKAQLDKDYKNLFTSIARTIASSKGRAFRDYDRRDAIKVYEGMSKTEELDPAELEKCHTVLDQKVLDKIEKLKLGPDEMTIENQLEEIFANSNSLLSKTVQQKAIKRLAENPDLAEWVAQGIGLHKKHKSKTCEYCMQIIPEARSTELAEHFNAAHDDLITQLDDELGKLRVVYSNLQSLTVPDKSSLYEHLKENYTTDKDNFELRLKDVLDQLAELGEKLNEKKVRAHESLDPLKDFDLQILKDARDKLNISIQEHNNISDDFEKTTALAKKKLEKHYVSTVFEKAKYFESEIEENAQLIETTEIRIRELVGIVSSNEAKIRSSKVACEKINKMLKEFLGRGEICFEDAENGYLIKRDKQPAKDLSEGEKTAIALVYFIICLESDSFDLKKGIVVIDDPISSLDMDAVYRVCALIKSKMRKARQLILLTHNYEFFNQVKDWFNNDPDISAKDKDPLKVNGQYFMVKNPFNDQLKKRVAILTELDPLLRNYRSEYHYLFKKLMNYKEDIVKTGDSMIEAVYPYPTIARKAMECFLSFRVPQLGSMQVRINKLRSFNPGDITEEEIDDVYNFVNSHSHLDNKTGLIQFDPTLEKNGEKYIEMTLELIKKVDPKHHADMMKAVQ